MNKIKMVDLEANCLEPEEEKKGILFLQKEMGKHIEIYKGIGFEYPGKPEPLFGHEVFVTAQRLEEVINLVPKPLRFVREQNHILTELKKHDENYWEIPYVQGKNLMFALANFEMKVARNLNSGNPEPETLTVARVEIPEMYEQARVSLLEGIQLYGSFLDSKDKQLGFYLNTMKGYLAATESKEIEWSIEIHSAEELMNQEVLVDNYTRAGMAEKTYREMFDGFFQNESTAAMDLVGLANVTKFMHPAGDPRVNLEKSLQYYQRATETLGRVPQIEKGLLELKKMGIYMDFMED